MATRDPVRTKVYEAGGYTYVCEAAVDTPLSEASWAIQRYDSTGSNSFPVVGGATVTGRSLVASSYASYTYTAIDS
jgi:hypothetical protein